MSELCLKEKVKENPDLHIIFSNQVSQVIHIGGKRITKGPPVLMFRCGLVPPAERLVEWWPVGRVIGPRVAEIDEMVPCGTPSARISFHLSTKILAFAWSGRMERVWIHTRWIKHNVLICKIGRAHV